MKEKINVMSYGHLDVYTATEFGADVNLMTTDGLGRVLTDWALFPDESKKLRKALKKAEKTVSRGE